MDGATEESEPSLEPESLPDEAASTDTALDCAADEEPSIQPSQDFRDWIAEHPLYRDRNIVRNDLEGMGFGGLIASDDCIQNIPIVFVHGNSDRALGGPFGGWQKVRDDLRVLGYRSSELYATTYGPATASESSNYSHSHAYLHQVRVFMEAVLSYTESDTIHVVAHSLGVTMARKAILGGVGVDDNGTFYDLGAPLSANISVFVGIAGANQGLASCTLSQSPICGTENGLYPGVWNGLVVMNQADILQDINSQEGYEAERVYSIWSQNDVVIGLGCLVWGENTCRIPGQFAEHHYAFKDHLTTRDDSAEILFEWLMSH